MDGNGRWAKKKVAKKIGHEFGIKNCISICEQLENLNILQLKYRFMYFQLKIGIEIHQR